MPEPSEIYINYNDQESSVINFTQLISKQACIVGRQILKLLLTMFCDS